MEFIKEKLDNLTIKIPQNIPNSDSDSDYDIDDNKENKPVSCDIVIIFDESGSMSSMGVEPVDGVNAFIEGQRDNSFDDTQVTFAKFSDTVNIVYKDIPLKDIKKIEYSSYIPNGMTALNDAIGTCFVDKLESGRNKNVIAFIMTDGEENASRRYSRTDVKQMIKNAEDNFGWKVIFLGANFDVETIGSNMNINLERCTEYNQNLPGNFLNICRTTSECVKLYRHCRSTTEDIELKIPNQRSKTSVSPPCRHAVQSPLPPRMARQASRRSSQYSSRRSYPYPH